MLYAKLITQDGEVLRLDIETPSRAAGFDMDRIRHAMICQTLGNGDELDMCGTTFANGEEMRQWLEANGDNAKVVMDNAAAGHAAERAAQPRERAAMCPNHNPPRENWNLSGLCDSCERAAEVARHPAGRKLREVSEGQHIVRFGGDGRPADCQAATCFGIECMNECATSHRMRRFAGKSE